MTNKLNLFPALLASALAVSGCGEATPADAEPNPEVPTEVTEISPTLPDPDEVAPAVGQVDSACRANLAEPFIGETLDLNTRTALLEAVAPQAITRFIEPVDEIDAEATNADRLNIVTDEDDLITEVFCG